MEACMHALVVAKERGDGLVEGVDNGCLEKSMDSRRNNHLHSRTIFTTFFSFVIQLKVSIETNSPLTRVL